VAAYTGTYITDQDIVDISTDKLITIYAWDEWPWLSLLGRAKATGDQDHKWLDSPEGLVKTAINMSGGMSGGASEEITVDSTAYFKAEDAIAIQQNTQSPQMAYISAVGSTTTMTIYPFSGELSAHDDNTVILYAGHYKAYGPMITRPLRQPNDKVNYIEQVDAQTTLPVNVAEARFLNELKAEAWFTRDMISQLKQSLTVTTLLGEGVDPTTGEGKGKMNGIYNLIPTANKSTGTAYTKAAIRDFINGLKKRGAFPNNKGIGVINSEMLNSLMKLDDSKAGISERDTDTPIHDWNFRGIKFKLVEEMLLNDFFASGKEAGFFLTQYAKGEKLLKLATIARKKRSDGKVRHVLEEEAQFKMQTALFCTMELRDDFRHGLFLSST
jgi:hypothetical protein